MLERLIIRRFKRFDEAEIELGQAVVLIGPNNSGKTSALQALALWELGVRRWSEKRGPKPPKKRSGVTLSRRDLISLPLPEANLLWRNLHVRDVTTHEGKPRTENVRVEIEVRGVTDGANWACPLEFDYANSESIYVRPLGWAGGAAEDSPIPQQALGVRVAFLPPMSGLSANEVRLDAGAVGVRLGEGRTAEVLRNLCYAVHQKDQALWDELVSRTKQLFGITIDPPQYVEQRGELTMSYREPAAGIDKELQLDVSAAGRGVHQTVLLLAYLLTNPGAVLLLDEPDAHLEVLRQREIYNLLTEVASRSDAQVIAASHSEVVLNEAADRDVVVAFVGKPHRIDDRGTQVLKALKEIGFDQYYQAELRRWVLYVEGATDLAILRAFADVLGHRAANALESPFVHYIGNQLSQAQHHFHGLREAQKNLLGYALTDCDPRDNRPAEGAGLRTYQWHRREIENYLCMPAALEAYAAHLAAERSAGPLFASAESQRFQKAMSESVQERVPPAALTHVEDPWWRDVKATDDFLDLVFQAFFKRLHLPNLMRKTDYHRVASFVPRNRIDPEVVAVLDAIADMAERATGAG